MRSALPTLCVSLLLHGAAFWAMLHWVPKQPAPPPKATRHTVVLSPVPRAVLPVADPPAAVASAAKPRTKARRAVQVAPRETQDAGPVAAARPEPAKAPRPAVADPAAPNPPSATQSPADADPAASGTLAPAAPLNLFAGVERAAQGSQNSAPAAGAAAGDPNAALVRANHSLQVLKHELRGARRAGVVPRGVKAFGERLSRTFVPEVDSLRRASSLGLGTLSMLPHYLQRHEEQQVTRDLADKQRGHALPPLQKSVGACFGACDGFKHDSATLQVKVAVQHDAAGKPRSWRVQKSSGEPLYDQAALDSVRDAAAVLPPWEDGVPRETHWEFTYQALRWGRMELILDPLLQTPGREVQNGLLGKTTTVHSIALVWVDMRDGPAATQGMGSTKQAD